jgi:hypothetical protein
MWSQAIFVELYVLPMKHPSLKGYKIITTEKTKAQNYQPIETAGVSYCLFMS